MKYKNYLELSAAFKSGEFDSRKYRITLDKSGTENCFHSVYDPKLSDEENDALMETSCEIFVCGSNDIEELFKALGIPCRWC